MKHNEIAAFQQNISVLCLIRVSPNYVIKTTIFRQQEQKDMQEPLQKLQNLLQQPSHANTLSISDLILTNVNFNLIGGGGL